MPRSITHVSPARLVSNAILLAIGCGTILLKLPFSHISFISWMDALFTATTCLCTCGLMTVSPFEFTIFGQCVLLFLIQIGGLGLVSFFFILFFIHPGFSTQVIAGQVLDLESLKDVKKIIFFIISFTLIIELIGASIFFLNIYSEYSFLKALFLSVFHSVAAFCDAGISLFPDGMIAYKNHLFLLLGSCLVMLCGTGGFISWYEIFNFLKARYKKKRFHFSLQTKVVIYVTMFLIIGGTAFYWMLERHNTFDQMNFITALLNSLYNTVSSRGTGFATIQPNQLQLATLLLIMALCFIGAAPLSTGGGIKVTTFALCIGFIKAAVIGKTSVTLKGRTIAKDQLYKAMAITFLSLIWIVITTFFLLITERDWSFIDILFEVVSAFATLGLSLGITPYLSIIGKLFIIITMIIGRIGALTLVLAFYKKHEVPDFSYPEERILLG